MSFYLFTSCILLHNLIFKLSQETIAFKLPIDAVFFLQLNYFLVGFGFQICFGFRYSNFVFSRLAHFQSAV